MRIMRACRTCMSRVSTGVITTLLIVNIFVIFWHLNADQLDAGVVPRDLSAIYIDPDVISRGVSRLAAVERICAVLNKDELFRKTSLSGHALAATDNSLVFCVIPKAGCTFWKQVIRFINKDYTATVVSPTEINRVYTHFGPFNTTRVYELNNASNINIFNGAKGFKFMFSRDPYSRLWSGYLDKLFLPDFWWWLGRKVIDEVRQDPEEASLYCGHDVTFEEFLFFTTNRLKKHRYRAVDMHFDPIYKQCNPCQMKFDAIGDIETFSSDTKYILDSSKQGHVMKRSTNQDRAMYEIKVLVMYNFDWLEGLIERGNHSECYDHLDIARRLWKTFQYDGYLGESIQFPEGEYRKLYGIEQFKEVMIADLTKIRQNSGEEVKVWGSQRRKYLEKAYKTVSRPVLNAVRDAYARDFELFQYEKEPAYMFG